MEDNRLLTIINNNPDFRENKNAFEKAIIQSFSDDIDLARSLVILYRMGIVTEIGRAIELNDSLMELYFNKLKTVVQLEEVSNITLKCSVIMWFEAYGVETLGLLCTVKSSNSKAEEKGIRDVLLDDLELPSRAYNCLLRAGIHTLGEIADMTAEELMNVRNLGRKSYQDIVQKLAEYNLCLSENSNGDITSNVIDLGELITNLRISPDIKNALEHHNIDIIKDLCYAREREVSNFITDEQKEELIQWMNEMGISFRSESEYGFMYLYPERIKEIELKREPAWEYRLLIESAILNYNWLRKYREQKLVLWKAGENAVKMEYLTRLLGFLQDQIDKLQDYVHQLESCINIDIKEAIGPRGVPGDAVKIVAATEKLMSIYKSVIKWRLSFRSLHTEREYKKVIEEFCDCIESLCENMDVFYEKLLEAKMQLDDAMSGKIQHSDVHADLRIEVELRTAGMNREIEKLRQYASIANVNI